MNGTGFDINRLSTDDISRRLAHPAPLPEPEWALPETHPPKPAAVLLPLFRHKARWHLLFIRRARNRNDRHSGEVAFPGGRIEPEDANARQAAIREANEEIGLAGEAVALLGHMPEYRTSSNFAVNPVVGEIDWPARLRPDPAEVARIFSIPLDWLARPEHHEIRPW
jgi:8-oxo-dGTP pyrophosphatase MutT (NUDIX family)